MTRINLLLKPRTAYICAILIASPVSAVTFTTVSAKAEQEFIVEKKRKCNLVQTAESLGAESRPLTESMIVTTSDERTVSDLRDNPCVLSVGENKKVSIASEPNDPQFEQQWALKNTGQSVIGKKGKSGVDIGYTDVFGTVSNVQTNTKVAVVDTGVSQIDELEGRLTKGKDVLDEDTKPKDENGHGTFISSIIAASTNNDKQIAGINDNVRIMPVRVLNKKGVGKMSNLIKGIDYAIKNDADIINLSLVSQYSQQVTSVIERAHENGIVVVAAAGNEGVEIANSSLRSPISNEQEDDWVIGVSAHDNKGDRLDSSNYGENVDLIAPGDRIVGVNNTDQLEYQTGTSIATANVVGAISVWDALYDDITPQRAFDLANAYTDQNRLNIANVVQRLQYPDGTLIRSKNSGVFLLEDGKKRPITHPDIFLSYDYQWKDIIVVNQAQLDTYQTGKQLELRDGSLVSDANSVYVVDGGKLRPIKNGELFVDLGFRWENVRRIPDDVLDDHPQGDIIDTSDYVPNGAVVYSEKSTGVFLIDNDKKRPFYNPDIFLNRYNWQDTVKISDETLSEFEKGDPVLPRSGSLLADDTRVYVIDGKTKRPVSSAKVFLERGYEWMNVRTVTSNTLNLLETGNIIR